MSFQAPPTLQQLAIQVLANNKDLTVFALEDLLNVLFPSLFKEAFIKRRRKIVKHVVATWPYPNLNLGPLMDNFHNDVFHAVLEGIDWLSVQKVRPRRCRLKEIHLPYDFLEIWTPTGDLLQVPWPRSRMPPHRIHVDDDEFSFLYQLTLMEWDNVRLQIAPAVFKV